MDDDILINIVVDEFKEKIRGVLRRYFECNDSGTHNKEYDPDYTAQAAIDDIHEIIGEF